MKSQIPLNLWDKLWQHYSARVSYAQTYQQMIVAAGSTVANDHIAFRSLRLVIDTPDGKKSLGIDYLAGIVTALGYEPAGEYIFADQKLYARHYQHPEQNRFDLPKLFISELVVDEMPEAIATLIQQTVSSSQGLLNVQALANRIEAVTAAEVEAIASQLQTAFIRPWLPPKRSVIEAVNAVSQYGAWVLLHGYAVNHFTGYVNRQQTPQYPDIETTARGLASKGVPMKAEIEGCREHGLRQTATQAVTELVAVVDDVSGDVIHIPWTYAYYEIAERFEVEVAPGQKALFEAFLGHNAQSLFEMTKTSRKSEGSRKSEVGSRKY